MILDFIEKDNLPKNNFSFDNNDDIHGNCFRQQPSFKLNDNNKSLGFI